MSSSYSFPTFSPFDIVSFFAESGIASINPDDLNSPSSKVVCALYSGILADLFSADPDQDDQVDFGALGLMENPDHLNEAIRRTHLYYRLKGLFSKLNCVEFSFRDLLCPDSPRTIFILSAIVNFLLYREEKLNLLRPVLERMPSPERQHAEIDTKIAQLENEIQEHETLLENQQPLVEEMEVEVKKLKQNIHSLNKEQLALQDLAALHREKRDVLINKISQVDFELVKNAQENSELLSKIVKSPEKLQRALEEKKSLKTKEMDAQRLAMSEQKAKTAKLEVYSKAYEKLSNHYKKIVELQEKANDSKALEKEVKALKTQSSDEISMRSIEAQIVQAQGKVKQAEEVVKEMEKEKDAKFSEHDEKLDALKLEMGRMLESFKQRETEAKEMEEKGEKLLKEADSVGKDGKAKEHELLDLSKKIVSEYREYSGCIQPILKRFMQWT